MIGRKNKKKDLKDKKNTQENDTTIEDVELNETADNKDPVEEIDPLVKMEEEVLAWKDKFLRLQAEFDNFRKRNIKERANIIKTASGDVIGLMLPILDDFDRAINANESKDEDDVESIKEGFNLIHNKLKTSLENKGLKPMNANGEDFNPEFHQAITQIEAGEEMIGKVVDEVEKGYYLNDKILRFAKTVVGK